MAASATVSRLQESLDRLASKPIEPEHVSRIMQLARQVIEESGAKKRFGVLNLYCDWLVHVAIDRSDAGQNILAEIDDIVFARQRNNVFSPQVVQEAMSLNKMRDEFKSVCSEASVAEDLTSSNERWGQFTTLMLRDLCAKRLHYKQGKTNKILQGVLSSPRHIELYASSAVVDDDPADLANYPDTIKFMLKLEATKVSDPNFVVTLVIPVSMK